MSNQRRVFRNNLNNDHLRSPYARGSGLRTPNASRVAPKVSDQSRISDGKDTNRSSRPLEVYSAKLNKCFLQVLG